MAKNIMLSVLLFAVVMTSVSQERYRIKNSSINNSYSNFGATFFGDDKIVYASPSINFKALWKGNNQPFLDLYVADLSKEGDVSNPMPLSNHINTKYHEATASFSKDQKTIYFTRNSFFRGKLEKDPEGNSNLKIFKATLNPDGQWGNTTSFPFNNEDYSTGHPSLSADGRVLYFVSDMPGGYGETDIYKVTIDEKGNYGFPINLGKEINSPGREEFPYIASDGTLYFSSDKPGGMGGFDIYAVKENSYGKAATPVNLDVPVNSSTDDFAFVINPKTGKGFFSSDRGGGKGDDDIYFFEKKEPCHVVINGLVIDDTDGSIVSASEVVLMHGDEKIDSVTVGKDGRFHFDLDCDVTYKIRGKGDAYQTTELEVSLSEGDDAGKPFHLRLPHADTATKPFVNKTGDDSEASKVVINLKPLYFDTNSSCLRKASKTELKKLVDIMNENPEIVIRIEGYTDSIASEDYNLWLSSRRVESVTKYLLSMGIGPERLSGRGYGEYRLVNGCSDGVPCSEAEHQLNRRVEFVVLNPEKIRYN